MSTVAGTFFIHSDVNGKCYSLEFRPDRPQEGSVHPNGFTVELNGDQVRELVGEHRESELAKARLESPTQFSATITSDQYATYADL